MSGGNSKELSLKPFDASELNSFFQENTNENAMSNIDMKMLEGLTRLASDQNIQNNILNHEGFQEMIQHLQTASQASRPQDFVNEVRNESNILYLMENNSFVQNQNIVQPTRHVQIDHSFNHGNSSEQSFSLVGGSNSIIDESSSLPSSEFDNHRDKSPFFFSGVWEYVRNVWEWIFGDSSFSDGFDFPKPTTNNCELKRERHLQESFGSPGNPPPPKVGPVLSLTILGITVVLLLMVIRRNPQKFNMTVSDVREFSRLLVMSAIPRLLEVDKFASI